MYKRSDKKQVDYSLRQLAGGLFYHLRKKPLQEISITEICERAGVSRRTFYRNCEEKEDLIRFSTDVLVKEQLARVDFTSTDAHFLYRNFFAYWGGHREFLTILYRNGLFDLFLEEFMLICGTGLRYPLQEADLEGSANRDQRRRFANAFIVGGLGQMLAFWAKEGFQTTVEQVAGSILFLVPVHG